MGRGYSIPPFFEEVHVVKERQKYVIPSNEILCALYLLIKEGGVELNESRFKIFSNWHTDILYPPPLSKGCLGEKKSGVRTGGFLMDKGVP